MNADRRELKDTIDNWFLKHEGELIDDLRRLISVKSVRGEPAPCAPYGKDSRNVLKTARKILEKRGFEVSDFEDIIITADAGTGSPKLGILAHLDVVPAGEGWETDPFELTERDGFLYGRGTSDDKGPAAAAMYAMFAANEISKGKLNGLRLILGSGEETGCDDIALYLRKETPPPCVFTPDAAFPVYNVEKGRFLPSFTASWDKDVALPRVISVTGGATANIVPNRASAVIKGFSLNETENYCREFSVKTGASLTAASDGDTIIITAEGTASHAASPEFGVNAQTALISMLSSMPFSNSDGFKRIKSLNKLFPHGDTRGVSLGINMRDELTGDLTVNFGVLSLTETGFTANFDSRTPACADEHDLPALVTRALAGEGIKMSGHVISKCHHTPGDSEFVKTLLRVYEEYTGNKGECRAMGGTTYVHEVPGGVAFGCGFDGSDDRIHGANERISLNNLILSAKIFTQVILDMCLLV